MFQENYLVTCSSRQTWRVATIAVPSPSPASSERAQTLQNDAIFFQLFPLSPTPSQYYSLDFSLFLALFVLHTRYIIDFVLLSLNFSAWFTSNLADSAENSDLQFRFTEWMSLSRRFYFSFPFAAPFWSREFAAALAKNVDALESDCGDLFGRYVHVLPVLEINSYFRVQFITQRWHSRGLI